MKYVIKFSAAFEKEQGASFLAAWMVVTVDSILLSYCPTGDRRLISLRNGCVSKFPLQCLYIFNIFEDSYERKNRIKTFGISHLDDGTFLSTWTLESLHLARDESK